METRNEGARFQLEARRGSWARLGTGGVGDCAAGLPPRCGGCAAQHPRADPHPSGTLFANPRSENRSAGPLPYESGRGRRSGGALFDARVARAAPPPARHAGRKTKSDQARRASPLDALRLHSVPPQRLRVLRKTWERRKSQRAKTAAFTCRCFPAILAGTALLMESGSDLAASISLDENPDSFQQFAPPGHSMV
jgi:hypothetical protein